MKKTLSRHAMTFVLLFVLVWYTAVNPSYAPAPRTVRGVEPSDDEGTELERVSEKGFAGVAVRRAVAPRALAEEAGDSVDDLDWPEVIGGD
jgi:hypothetical protein